jgi:hypothetical protein
VAPLARRHNWLRRMMNASPTAQATIVGVVLTSLTAAPPAAAGLPPRAGRAIDVGAPAEWTHPVVAAAAAGAIAAASPRRSRSSSVPRPGMGEVVAQPASPRDPLALPTPPVNVVKACGTDPGDEVTVTVTAVGVNRCVNQSWVPACAALPDVPPIASCQTEGEPSYFVPIPPHPGIG